MTTSYTVIELNNKWATLEASGREIIKIPKLWLPSECEVGSQVLAEVKLSDGEGMVEFMVAEATPMTG